MFSEFFNRFHLHVEFAPRIQPPLIPEHFHELQQGHVFEDKLKHDLSAQQKCNQDINYDARNAMWFYLRAALRGNKDAQYKLGLSYLNGELGLDRSYTHAEKWLDQAADQGHPQAKADLADALNKLSIS